MKSNLQYIFDKITAPQDAPSPGWRHEERDALIARVRVIGLADRGADIGPGAAAQLADALLAARHADRATMLLIRRSLRQPPEER